MPDEEVVVREDLFEVDGPDLFANAPSNIRRVTKDFPLDFPAIDERIAVPI